jgi:two-component system chemotaxis sensor kinase CheA
VVESDRMNFCMQADELIGKQEVVIKSLGETFKNIPGIAGGAILGDGRAGLILDVEALFGNAAHE